MQNSEFITCSKSRFVHLREVPAPSRCGSAGRWSVGCPAEASSLIPELSGSAVDAGWPT